MAAIAKSADSQDEQSEIQLITVTAQRSTEDIQEVAESVDSATARDIPCLGINNANGLNKISLAFNLPLSIEWAVRLRVIKLKNEGYYSDGTAAKIYGELSAYVTYLQRVRDRHSRIETRAVVIGRNTLAQCCPCASGSAIRRQF
jgi:hypothetical protein